MKEERFLVGKLTAFLAHDASKVREGAKARKFSTAELSRFLGCPLVNNKRS
jgi:hypothetical protein